jgi:hypothetical protein
MSRIEYIAMLLAVVALVWPLLWRGEAAVVSRRGAEPPIFRGWEAATLMMMWRSKGQIRWPWMSLAFIEVQTRAGSSLGPVRRPTIAVGVFAYCPCNDI